MKNKNLHTAIAYWFLILGLVLFISGCRTKKSTTDFKQTETENVSITDNSTVAKKETVEENSRETKNETVTDKSFFESWMSFESDKITITDNKGNKTEITNPRINKKQSQTNDIAKTEQSTAEKEKSLQSEEKKQTERKENLQRETKTDLKTTDERKTKIVWFYWIGGLLIAGFGYGILKKFNLIK